MRIKDKAQFRAMWLAGKFGNKPRVWRSYDEIVAAGYHGNVAFRMHVPNSKHTRYGVQASQIPTALEELSRVGIQAKDVWFNESAPDDRLVLQGEYFDGEKGPALYDRCLTYSRAKTQMKTALALPLHGGLNYFGPNNDQFRRETEGINTELLLQSVMNCNSWDDFNELRELYPGHVIEFSVYDHCVGDCPHRNTLFWEIRDY